MEPAECPFERGDWARDVKIDCRLLVVSEARGNPKSRTIKLAVVIFRAKEPDGSPPVVFLHGGPGGSGIRQFTRVAAGAGLDRRRDVVIYDQRGAGFSEPTLCPEYQDVRGESQRLNTRKDVEESAKAATRKCITSLDARIERSAYNTGESAADLIDLRQALEYSAWDIFSESYGSRLALEAMRRDPEGIRAVVFDKPSTRGPAREAEVALSNQRAFERIFADCRAQPDCHDAFPTLENDFYDVYDKLNRSPLSVRLDQTLNEGLVILDGKRFVDRIRNDVFSIGDPDRLAQLPLIINEFRRGDRTRAAHTLVGYNPRAEISGESVLISLVNCNDVYGERLRAKRREINAKVRLPFRRDLMEECKLWQKRFADPSEWAPVQSDIPTLIVTGRYDDRAPTELAKRTASTLTRAYLYEFPNEAHGAPKSPCHGQVVFQFLAEPFREPDTSCVNAIPPVRFITRWQQSSGSH